MKKFFLLSILLPFGAFAQDLSTEVVVDRTVAVELPEASPLAGVGPALSLPMRSDAALRISDYTMSTDFEPSVARNSPFVYTGIPAATPYRGFAWLGYFPAYNLDAGVGYQILDSDADKLGVAASFEGASWHGFGSKDVKPSVNYNTFKLIADYRHTFNNNATVYAKADYAHDALRMPYFSPHYDADAPQAFNHGNFAAGIMRDGKINYAAQLYYRFFDVADEVIVGAPDSPVPGTVAFDGASDNYFGANGHIGAWISDKSAVKIGVDIAHQNASGIRHDMFSPIRVNNSRWIIGLNPTFTFSIKNFDVRLGIHADYCSSTSKALFLVAPDVGIVWNAAKWAEVYFDADGGERFNSLADLYNYSVFAPGFSVFDTMWNKVDAKAGIRLGSFRGFSAGVHAAYAATSDAPMPDILSFDSGRTAAAFVSRSVSGWRFGVDFSYRYSDILSASIGGEVFSHGFGKGYWLNIDNARATLDAKLSVKASDRLTIAAKYKLRACRFAYYNIAGTYGEYSLGNISDLGLEAVYRMSDRLSFFADIDNMLCRRYQILPGITSRRLHGLIGATYQF